MMPFSISLLSDRLDNMMAALQSFSHLSTEKHVDSMYCDRSSFPLKKLRHRARNTASPEPSSVLDILEPVPVAHHQWQDYSIWQSSLTTSGTCSGRSSLSATDHSTIIGSEGVCSPYLPDKILPKIDFADSDTSCIEGRSTEVGASGVAGSSTSEDVVERKFSEDPVVSYNAEAPSEYPKPLSPPPFRLRRPRSRLVMIPDSGPEDPPQRKRSNTICPGSPRVFAGPPRFEF